MRLSDLRGKAVRSLDGKSLGRVHEIHCDSGRIVALMCGPASVIERWTAKSKGGRVSWDSVLRIEKGALVISEQDARKRARAK
jgi:sporulation protein YlmC with PRC-barrel domain